MDQKSALEKAIDAAGSQLKLATILGVSQQVISYWVKTGRVLTAEHALIVERNTGVSKHVLRPDIFGEPPTGPALQATG